MNTFKNIINSNSFSVPQITLSLLLLTKLMQFNKQQHRKLIKNSTLFHVFLYNMANCIWTVFTLLEKMYM